MAPTLDELLATMTEEDRAEFLKGLAQQEWDREMCEG